MTPFFVLINMKDFFMSKQILDSDWDLMARHFAGETGKEEEDLLNGRLKNSEKMRECFADLSQWWEQTDPLFLYGKMDTEADWRQLKQRLREAKAIPDAPAKKRRLSVSRRLYYPKIAAAAAAILIFLGLACYYVVSGSSERKQPATAFHQITVPNGQKSQLILSDGTSVWLNSGSNLQFPTAFEDGIRMVKLDGEALFEVSANKTQSFVVQTPHGLSVKVYGTSFNVTSYADEERDIVTLFHGSVSVSATDGKEIMLSPGHKIDYEPGTGVFSEPVSVNETIAAWRHNRLVFDNEPFSQIARKLERHYNVTIRIEDALIGQQRYRGAFRKETLEQAIKAIQLTAKYRYEIKGDEVVIY
jgi:ferric-dicitrate binding protein FerR (iron transport regulator)